MDRLRPFFPKRHGKLRVDDRRVLSGIIFINRNELRWCDALREYGPPKTLYYRWKRWGDMAVFARIMEGLAPKGTEQKTVLTDATYLKAHRTVSRLRAKKGTRRQARASDRANERRSERQTARRHGRRGMPHPVLHDGGPSQQTHRRGGPAGQPCID